MNIDLPTLVRLSASLPLPQLLLACDDLVGPDAECDVWLWDHQRTVLTSIRTNASVEPQDRAPSDVFSAHTSAPIIYQGDELGVLTVAGPDLDDQVDEVVALLATAVRAGEPTTDTINVRRRRRAMSLPAEMQWALLPPTQFSLPGAEISAAVEPAYDTGGDVFDYAINGDKLSMAVLDARGHGLRAATTATVATSAMRRARRSGASLLEIASDISASVNAIGDDADFVSGVLLEIDITTWEGTWISAGHLPPLLMNERIEPLDLRPALPLGMVIGGSASEPVEQPFALQPGQALTLYSDGMIENVALDVGDALGDDRFHQILHQQITSTFGELGQPQHVARSVVNDLLQLTGTVLRDDATIMVLNRPTATS